MSAEKKISARDVKPGDVAAFFDSLSEKEIRRRQELCAAQMAIAHRQNNTKALRELHRMEADLTAAMLRRS